MATLIPVSFIIPTANRKRVLANTVESLARQLIQPVELIVVDGSDTNDTADYLNQSIEGLVTEIKYLKAEEKGAAIQRTQGYKIASQEFIGFMDDDVVLENDCLRNLWQAILSLPQAGGINAMITNQHYALPSRPTRAFYWLMDRRKVSQPGGRLFGPLINTLPSDDSRLPDIVPVDWMNAGCTIYRRKYLPEPLFDKHFQGYSLMEDLALSLRVSKKAPLYNIRSARIYHDTQPGAEKNNIEKMAEMELVNRYYIMRNIAEMRGISSVAKLVCQQLYFGLITRNIFKNGFWRGKLKAIRKMRESR